MLNKHVISDAKRCIQCKNPLCSKGCPVATPIKEAISLLLAGKMEEAGHLLFSNNPLALVCSYICPQDDQCEGHCVLGRKGMPVQVSAIERYISDYYLTLFTPKPSLKNKGKIAVIGSGPAGIVIAFMLAAKDYDVTIFEGHDRIGGILRYGIPEFRLPKNILDRISNMLMAAGVTIRPNTIIGTSIVVDEFFRDGFHAVFMGTGTWKPLKLNIKGESLGHVHYAIDYLKNPDVYHLGKRVAVIGAGNVAMDVARTALRHGSREATVYCRRSEADMTAREIEIEFAKIDGVTFEYNKIPVEIKDGSIIVADSETYASEDGKNKVRVKPGSEQPYDADSVIVAISQGPRALIVSSTDGIDVNKKSGLVVADGSGQTTRPGVFASGDVVTGGKTVVEAVRYSRIVAEKIDEYVQGLGAGV
jgi:glutamate synthase (NADPH/NADH) small chain